MLASPPGKATDADDYFRKCDQIQKRDRLIVRATELSIAGLVVSGILALMTPSAPRFDFIAFALFVTALPSVLLHHRQAVLAGMLGRHHYNTYVPSLEFWTRVAKCEEQRRNGKSLSTAVALIGGIELFFLPITIDGFSWSIPFGIVCAVGFLIGLTPEIFGSAFGTKS